MKEFEFNVRFGVEAEDRQSAVNALHLALQRAGFPDEVDWKFSLTLDGRDAEESDDDMAVSS